MSCATDSRPARTERKPLHRHRFTDSSIAVVVFAELDVSSWCHWFLIARRCRTRCSNAFGAGALDSDDKVAVVKRLAVTPPGVNNVGTRVDSLLCHPGAGRYRAGIRWPTIRRTSMPFFCSTQAWVLDFRPANGSAPRACEPRRTSSPSRLGNQVYFKPAGLNALPTMERAHRGEPAHSGDDP